MKNNVKKEVSKVVLSAALGVAANAVTSSCIWSMHQPKEPEALAKSQANMK